MDISHVIKAEQEKMRAKEMRAKKILDVLIEEDVEGLIEFGHPSDVYFSHAEDINAALSAAEDKGAVATLTYWVHQIHAQGQSKISLHRALEIARLLVEIES